MFYQDYCRALKKITKSEDICALSKKDRPVGGLPSEIGFHPIETTLTQLARGFELTQGTAAVSPDCPGGTGQES